jgi:hypothetical protein
MKWWKKGIILSIIWVALMVSVMFLAGGANSDQLAERYGRGCGMVLIGGWFFAIVSQIRRSKQP